MEILKNNFNRFEIKHVVDPGFGTKKVKGINGYHGLLGYLIGLILDKIFHKTVAVKLDKETFYFNCRSLVKWLNRAENLPDWDGSIKKIIHEDEIKELGILGPNPKALDKKVHESEWVTNLLKKIAETNEVRFNWKNQQNKIRALAQGNLDEARALGVNEGLIQDNLNNELKQALGSDLEKCRELIEKGASVNPIDVSPLCWVCHINIVRNNEEKVLATCSLLLERGADINMHDHAGGFPLEEAVKSKSLNLVTWFLENGADKNLKTFDGKSLLELAVEYDCSDELKKILEEGPKNIIILTPKEREELNKKNEELIRKKEKLNKEMEDAAEKRDFEKYKKLIEQGADKNIYLKRLNRDLWFAIAFEEEDKNKWEILIKQGAEINPTVSIYTTPLIATIENKIMRDKLSLCEFLLEKGASINMRDQKSQKLPIEVAILEKNSELVAWLISKGADIQLKTSHGESLEQLATDNHLPADIIQSLQNQPKE